MKRMKYFTDGFTIAGNPSDIGGGYTITDESGRLILREVIWKEGITCNECEILGVLSLLESCVTGDVISTDSMNSISWVGAGKSKARPDLLPILQKCKQLKLMKGINLMWEAREFNLAGHYNEKNQHAVSNRIT